MSGLCFYSWSSLAFVTLNPSLCAQPCPLGGCSVPVPGAGCRRPWTHIRPVFSPVLTLCPSCQETGFLFYSPVITSPLGVSFLSDTMYSVWISCPPFLSDLSAHNAFQAALHLDPVFTVSAWLLTTPHLPFHLTDSSSHGRALRPAPLTISSLADSLFCILIQPSVVSLIRLLHFYGEVISLLSAVIIWHESIIPQGAWASC